MYETRIAGVSGRLRLVHAGLRCIALQLTRTEFGGRQSQVARRKRDKAIMAILTYITNIL